MRTTNMIRVGAIVAAVLCASPRFWSFGFAMAESKDGVAQPASSQPATTPTTQPSDSTRDEMIRKLLGGASTAVDQVEAMLGSMSEASGRLNEQRDAGPQTQAAQRRVLEGLDLLIRQAGENRRATPQPSRVRPRGERDPQRRRTADERRPKNEGKGGQAQRGGPGAVGGAGEESSSAKKTAKAELVRGWGYLPGRERDEVIQGFDEEFLAKYREEIMRYYRSLANSSETRPSAGNE